MSTLYKEVTLTGQPYYTYIYIIYLYAIYLYTYYTRIYIYIYIYICMIYIYMCVCHNRVEKNANRENTSRKQIIVTIKETLNLQPKNWHQLTYQCLKNNCYLVLSYLTDVNYQSKHFKTFEIVKWNINDDKPVNEVLKWSFDSLS